MEEFPLNHRPKLLRANQQIPHFTHVEEAIDGSNDTTLLQLSVEEGGDGELARGELDEGIGEANLAK